MAEYRKKDEIEQENSELKSQIETLREERSELLGSLNSLTERVDEMSNQMQATRESDGVYDPEPDLVYDPFDEQNPHAIRNHPEGWVLSWKNPDYRAHRGWRGWVPVEHDDEIGQNLSNYLQDPPTRMEGMAQVDNYVRRGTDSILCKIPKDIWDARQRKRTQNAKQRFRATQQADNSRSSKYTTYGEGAVERKSGADPMESGEPTPMARTPLLRND
jgi:hypothetical protein